MYQALFFGYIFWVCLTLCCVAVLLMHHTMRGSWGLPILRVVEAGAKTLPITFIIFLVIALTGLKELYP